MLITEIMMKLVEIVTTIQFFGIILLLHILTLLSKFKPGSCLPVTYEHKSFPSIDLYMKSHSQLTWSLEKVSQG